MLLQFNRLGSYIRHLEDLFAVNGWEHRKPGPWMSISTTVLWIVLVALSIFALYLRNELLVLPSTHTPR